MLILITFSVFYFSRNSFHYSFLFIPDAPQHFGATESEFGDEESVTGSTAELVRPLPRSGRMRSVEPDPRIAGLTHTDDLSPEARAAMRREREHENDLHLPLHRLPPLPSFNSSSRPRPPSEFDDESLPGSLFGSQVELISDSRASSRAGSRSGARGGIADVSIA